MEGGKHLCSILSSIYPYKSRLHQRSRFEKFRNKGGGFHSAKVLAQTGAKQGRIFQRDSSDVCDVAFACGGVHFQVRSAG